MKQKWIGNLLLIMTAMIWGAAFVAQRVAMDDIGPLTFTAARSFIAALALWPVALWFRRGGRAPAPDVRRQTWMGGLCCGVVLFAASASQQLGLVETSAGKAAFITTLYIVLVPLVGLFFRRRTSPNVWIAVAVAAAGLYLLCMRGDTAISGGDLFVLLCAFLYTAHILVISHFSRRADCVMMSCVQFLVAGALSLITALLFETPRLAQLSACLWPLLYAGVFSSAVAYTLQIIAQKRTDPTVASLLMSLESVFAALSGWIFLGELFTPREWVGALLMLGAILLAQLPASRKQKRAAQTV